ncbi:hypothetical protein [Lysinibacillus fusiformis]|uniref:hypothetical protein n=1 Tax=Lysinibacillus fusiformis TaxID=28031 RepID=UPI00187EFC51|nr:hypothetical protein [Lysinibacillus fusiformis]MBD8523764.1 hypothetical protein [Lysinibacillus fusiformis]
MAIRLRKKKLIGYFLTGAMAMLIICLIGGYFFYQKAQEREIALKQEYQAKMEELQEVASQSEVVYTLKKPIEKGDPITKDILQKAYSSKAATAEDRFLIDMINGEDEYFAKTDLMLNTPVTQSMVYKNEMITKDVREGEYSFIELPTSVKADSFVDIRIQFPTGDDYVLLAKKRLKNVTGLTSWFDVDEGEILTMSSAIVDAYVEGAKIYAMPYVDEHMQDASQMTYPVKNNVKDLIKESPNIVNIAKLNLERQNRARMESYLKEMETAEREKIRAGETATKNEVNVDNEKRSAEERINAANQGALNQQEELVGGTQGGNE